jgi:SAM-dependent MidA family methyltransferase
MESPFSKATKSVGQLPPPTPEETARSDELAQHVREEIANAGGSIDFARFMELALYAPGLGYYRGGMQKFGAQGDFVTAPELSPLFARCIAKQCQQVFGRVGNADIVEVGAGSGALAVALLRELDAQQALPENYYILETSADLQQRQSALIAQEIPDLLARVHWLQTLPNNDIRGIVLANELLDAMPVHRFSVNEQSVQQLHVAWDGKDFVWHEKPADKALHERIDPLRLPPGYTSEVNFHAEAWVKSMAGCLRAGVMFLFDYGFPRAEFYHPQRRVGTLMCHYRHRYHPDPLLLIGLQDITAHIDFTAIAEAGATNDLSLLGYTSQAAFLLSTGITEFASASDHTDSKQHMKIVQQVNKLTSPAEMGELYKVIALGCELDLPLDGFTLQDRRARL